MQDDLTMKCQPERYHLRELAGAAERRAYDALLADTYRPLGFLDESAQGKVLPRADAERQGLWFRGQLAGIFCLSEPAPGSLYEPLVPDAPRGRRLLELGNFVLRPEFRGTIALALMVAAAARRAAARGFAYLVGTTRYQALPYFVEFGVVPVEHAPLHLLGSEALRDFVVYYDTHTPESMAYLEQRTRRYLHQVQVMTAIREKYIRRAPRATELAG